MFKKIIAALAAVFCALNAYSLNLSLNYSQFELPETAYDVLTSVAVSGEIRQGVSLAEIFPVLYDAWAIELKTPSETVRFFQPDLADSLSEIYIYSAEDGWMMEFQGKSVRRITSINIEGEALDRKPLEVWINWEGTDLLKKEISRYAELHNLEITVIEVPRPDSKLISVTRGGGRIPDVIMVQSSYIDSLVRSDSLQNIDYMYPDGLIEQGREAFSHSGKVWAVPFYYDAQLIFYNPEIVSGAGIGPFWSLSDFENICRQILKENNRKIAPSAWNAYSASFLIPFQIAFGKERLVEPDGTIVINDEPSRDALEYLLRLKNEDLMVPMERDAMTSLFVSGDVAMILSASYSIPHFENLGIPFRAAPLPLNEITGRRVSPLLDFKAFGMTKRTTNPVGARRLIEHLTSPGVQQRFTSAVSKLPSRESAMKIAEEHNKYYEVLKVSAEDGTIIPTDKAYSVYKNTMWKMLRFALTDRMTADQVLDKTQDLVNKNLEDIN